MKTKSILFITTIMLSLCQLQAQKNIEWIVSPMESFSIDKVITTTKKTTINMVYHGKAFTITASPRLIDQQGGVHPLTKIKGAKKGKNETKHNSARFSLSFTPLAPEDSIFDFVQGTCNNDYGCFLGVHKKGTAINISIPSSQCDTSLVFSRKDKYDTCIIGHIQNKKKGIAVMTHIDLDHDWMYKCEDTVHIDESGFFVFNTKIHGPAFTYVIIPDEVAWIPVFLNPEDTLFCNINIPSAGVHECDYKSLKGNNTCQNLMKANPTWRNYTHWRLNHKQKGTNMEQLFARAKNEADSLCMYLASKYCMSPFEYELLHINMLEELEYERIQGLSNKKEYDAYILPKEIRNSPVRFSCYSSPYLFHELNRLRKSDLLLPTPIRHQIPFYRRN